VETGNKDKLKKQAGVASTHTGYVINYYLPKLTRAAIADGKILILNYS